MEGEETFFGQELITRGGSDGEEVEHLKCSALGDNYNSSDRMYNGKKYLIFFPFL